MRITTSAYEPVMTFNNIRFVKTHLLILLHPVSLKDTCYYRIQRTNLELTFINLIKGVIPQSNILSLHGLMAGGSSLLTQLSTSSSNTLSRLPLPSQSSAL